jgi:3-polyprenyl-4-hydroxybenzoate decarboxylase
LPTEKSGQTLSSNRAANSFMDTLPLIIVISGASGAIYGVRLLQVLKGKIPTHLIVSRSAALTLKNEVDLSIEQVRALAQTNYQIGDIGARFRRDRSRRGAW